MNKSMKKLVSVGIALIVGFLLVSIAVEVVSAQGPGGWWRRGPGMMGGRFGYGPGMMGGWDYQNDPDSTAPGNTPYGYGPMMGGRFGYGPGMMGGWGYNAGPGAVATDTVPYGYGPDDCPMMEEGYAVPDESTRLSMDDAAAAAERYLGNFGNDNLTVAEVMAFSQNLYVQVTEASSGKLAFELLVDPYSGFVRPEPGPNMMWNTQYSHMAAFQSAPGVEMTVSEAEAIEFAQAYLDGIGAGMSVADHADAFPGYYTLHTLQDGQIVGMLSVNGYTGQVWYHTWHGDFLEMNEHLAGDQMS